MFDTRMAHTEHHISVIAVYLGKEGHEAMFRFDLKILVTEDIIVVDAGERFVVVIAAVGVCVVGLAAWELEGFEVGVVLLVIFAGAKLAFGSEHILVVSD